MIQTRHQVGIMTTAKGLRLQEVEITRDSKDQLEGTKV